MFREKENFMRIVIFAAAVLAAACTGPGGAGGAQSVGGVDLSQAVRALGTEPFWTVEITPQTLIYSGVDRPEQQVSNPGARVSGSTAVIEAKDAAGASFVITLKAAECSDGMSDRTYPLEAEVKVGAETLKGCAASEDFLKAQPPA
jgi:uncharacterized membrane protein